MKKNKDIFFDLDGTLHKQNMFSCFLYYIMKKLPLNVILLLLLLPLIGMVIILKGYKSRWPISLFLWAITFGRKEKTLQKICSEFITFFKKKVIFYHQIHACLLSYLNNSNNNIWIITGSPEFLVKKVYNNLLKRNKINLIGSLIKRYCGGWIIIMRCIGQEKVIQLRYKLGDFIKLHSGYSDDFKRDKYLLNLCLFRWKVMSNGQLKRI